MNISHTAYCNDVEFSSTTMPNLYREINSGVESRLLASIVSNTYDKITPVTSWQLYQIVENYMEVTL